MTFEIVGRSTTDGIPHRFICDPPILAEYITIQLVRNGSLVVNEIRIDSGIFAY